jgi:probable HAF family extracellular repeat protein
MKRRTFITCLVVFGLMSFSNIPIAVADVQMLATDLGSLGGGSSYALDINDLGQIVGYSELQPAGETHAVLWQDGQLIDLGSPCGIDTHALAINKHGQIVGYDYCRNNEQVFTSAFLWEKGTITNLGSLGGPHTFAYDINDLGQVVGCSRVNLNDPHAYIWENGVMINLGTLGGNSSCATSINNHKQVIGTSTTATGKNHSFIWDNGVMTDLGTLGGTDALIEAINDHGQVVGWSDTHDGSRHAFLWENGSMTDLGTLGGDYSYALDINDVGQIVGNSYTSSGFPNHAFLWQNGAMTDLGTLSGFSTAVDINNRGQIVGRSEDPSGKTRPVLWQNGIMLELGNLGGDRSEATAINELGQVIGSSNFASPTPGAHATLWQPNIKVGIGNTAPVSYWLEPSESMRRSYASVNNGPVTIEGLTGELLVASQRVIYGGTSYSEMMGLPAEQLTKEYLFPYYNNVAMDSQLRVSNMGGADTTITVYLAGEQIDQYALAAGGATRKNYTGKNSGPLRVTSSASNILATTRVLYGGSSYSELMGLPVEQLAKEYMFPYYNNVAMNSQLRVSNIGGADTTITVYLGTTQIDSYSLAAGGSTRKNYTGRNSGPLRVTSSTSNILATIRVLYNNNSYSELMGFPANQLEQEYWYPVYDNAALESQLRVSNVGTDITTITVYAGGTQIDNYTLNAGAATRKTYPKNTGPLDVVSSTQPVLTTIRLLYGGSSYYEMTGLPNSQLSTQYFFPWYNNKAMESELRLAVP